MTAPRVAALYLRSGFILIVPHARSTAGVYIGIEPVLKLPEPVSEADLGDAVLSALASGREGLPHPSYDEMQRLKSPVLRAAGVKTNSAFAKSALSCDIEDDGNVISIAPMRRAPRGAFVGVPGKVVKTRRDVGAAAIGAAAREALSYAE